MGKIKYTEMIKNQQLMVFDGQKVGTEESRHDGDKKMAQITWDEALASSGYVKLESEVRKTLVGKNARLERKEKFGEQVNCLTLDIVEEDEAECEKLWEVSSKRLLKKLRPIFEAVAPDAEVRFSVKRIGDRFDTSYDVEQL